MSSNANPRGLCLLLAALVAACNQPRAELVEDAALPLPADGGRIGAGDRPLPVDAPPEPPLATAGREAGAACEEAAQCATRSCVDGRCCQETACGVCQRCSGSGGRCALVADEEDDSCRSPARCNGASLCIRPFNEYPLPAQITQLESLTAGPDGALWFTQAQGAKIGRMTLEGAVSELSVLDAATDRPGPIVTGPDRNLWFTLGSTSKIARLNPSGTLSTFDAPGTGPRAIEVGPDASLWFSCETGAGGLGRISVAGAYTRIAVDDFRAFFLDLAAGADGNLWVLGPAAIARVTPGGLDTRFALPFPGAPRSITAGPDGALWFTVPTRRSIGRITTAGAITELVLPENGDPFAIVSAPDGHLWFTEPQGNQISRLTTAGAVTRFVVPTAASRPTHLTVGPDRAIWFYQSAAGKIGRFRM
jgi:virginiamycin B lyase